MGRNILKKAIYYFAAATFVVLVVLPVTYAFFQSFFIDGNFSLEHYQNVITSGQLKLLVKSCWMSGSIAALATLIGGTLGFVLSKTKVPLSNTFKLILLIPLFVSPYYFAVAWRDVFVTLSGTDITQEKTWAVIFVLTSCFFPLPMVIISNALNNINRHLEEAGFLFTSRFKVFWGMTLPLIKNAFTSSFILVFILSISDISVVSYYIVPSFASDIFIQFSAYYHYQAAIASSLFIVLLCVILLIFERSYLLDAPFLNIGTKGHATKKWPLNNKKYLVIGSLSLYTLIAVFVPIIFLAYQAFKPGISSPLTTGTMPSPNMLDPDVIGGLGFQVKNAFEALQPVIGESLLYAFLGALIICVFGFVLAYFAVREQKRLIDFLLLITFATPSTVIGIGLIKFFNRPSLEFIYSSFAIVLIGYFGKFTFIASKVIGHSIKQIPESMEEAATLAGAGFLARLRKIVFPLSADASFAAFIICFVFCLGEIATTIVVYPPGTSLLPIKIATSMHNSPDGLITAMVLIALMVTLLALAILFLLRKFLSSRLHYDWNRV